MPGLYDRLQAQIGDDDDKPSGLTPLDLTDLPDEQRRVMLALLRGGSTSSGGMTLAALQAKLPDLAALPGVLDDLVRQGWLIERGEPPTLRYKVNLRRKRGSDLFADLWTTLLDRLEHEGDEADPAGG